jgi:hypothetical protein
MKREYFSYLYILAVGILLGLLQSGLFFLLTFTLSSGFTTYLLITLCWLIGGVIGTIYVKNSTVSIHSLLVIMVLAYALCIWVVNINQFDTSLWPLYGFLISLAGLYPGVFFARTSKFIPARSLFFWENNGFILGLVTSGLIFMLFGRGSLWVLTIALVIVVWYLHPQRLSPTKRSFTI